MSSNVSTLEPINLSIVLGNTPVDQKSFNLPIIFGIKQPTYFLDVLKDAAGLIWKAVTAGVVYIAVEYVVSGNSTSLSVTVSGSGTQADPSIITVNVATDASGNATSTANEIKLAAEAAAGVAGTTPIVTVDLALDPGDGVVSAFAQASLDYERYMEITGADDLLGLGFIATDDEYLAASALFSQNPSPATCAVYLLTAWANLQTEIAALRDTGKDAFYKVIGTTRDKAEMQSLSDYLATIGKQYFGCTDDITVLTNRNQQREYFLLHKDPTNFPEARWVGAAAARQIGSFNYAYLLLNGVINSGFSNSDSSSILSDKGNLIMRYGGKDVTYPGISTAGVYADVVANRDLLEARLQEAIASTFINNDIIPYTTEGFDVMEAAMRQVFDNLAAMKIVAPVLTSDDKTRSDLGKYQYILTFPQSVDVIPDNDRNNRKLPLVTFSARLSGAINTMDVSGVLT